MSDLFSVKGKHVLITGGSQGLGHMVAEQFVRGGAHVMVTSRSLEAAQEAAAALQPYGDCTGLAADLSNPEGAVALADQIKASGKPLNVLINNAGAASGAPIEKFPDSDWPNLMAINVQSPFTMVRELLPLLRESATEQDPSRIINTGSFVGHSVPFGPSFAYAASKAAIHHLTRVLAADLAASHITVNAVAPGYFKTRMTDNIPKKHIEFVPSQIPLTRFGNSDDISGAFLYLASRAGAYLTGVVLPVDGGLSGAR